MNTPCEVVALVDLPAAKQGTTNPHPAGLAAFDDVARQREIKVFSPANPNEPRFVEKMQVAAPDLFIAVGYALILKQALLALPKVVAANFTPRCCQTTGANIRFSGRCGAVRFGPV